MSIEDITNHMVVSDKLASSGQPTKSQFKDIAEAGFEVVINLAMPDSDYAIPEEGCIVTARKMVYAHLPVPYEAPTAEHLRMFFAIMKAFGSKTCWVHCALNYRVSAFLYQYFRLVHNVSPDEARKAIFAGWDPDQVWSKFMALDEEDVGF